MQSFQEAVARGLVAALDVESLCLGLQINQSRSYLYTFGSQVGISSALGALGFLGSYVIGL